MSQREFTRACFTREALDADIGRGDFESARFSGLAVRFDSPIETFPSRTKFGLEHSQKRSWSADPASRF